MDETTQNVTAYEQGPGRIACYQIEFNIYKLAVWMPWQIPGADKWQSRLFVQDEVSGKEEPIDNFVYVHETYEAALMSAGVRIAEAEGKR